MSCPEKCQNCGKPGARAHVFWTFRRPGELSDQVRRTLCRGCRNSLSTERNEAHRNDRQRFLRQLDHFFEESGALEICARCHAQGTGCCPSGCRRLTPAGCSQKILWCGTFICSALLGALWECSPEAARLFTWLRKEVGAGEWHLYELVTRMPASEREAERHVLVSSEFPSVEELGNAAAFKLKLASLTDEILEIRRAQESSECSIKPSKPGGNCF